MGEHDLDEYCAEHGFCAWFKTSAKEGEGITAAAETLIANVIAVEESGQYEVPVLARDADVHRLDNAARAGKPPAASRACDC